MSKTNSVTLTKKNYDALKEAADKKGTNVYTLLNALLKDIGVADKEEKIILCVPHNLASDNKDGLRSWLETSVEKIIGAYYPEFETACR